MKSIKELIKDADDFRKNNNFDKAIEIYSYLWNEKRNECDKNVGWRFAYCYRKTEKPDDALKVIKEVYKLTDKDKVVNSEYSRILYDKFLKVEVINDEQNFLKVADCITKLCQQENTVYCIYTHSIFKVLKFYKSKSLFNENAFLDWTSKLNPHLLSTLCNSQPDNLGITREYASKKEEYYMYRTKALFRKKLYQECKSLCIEALKQIEKLHYDNEIWFRRRQLLSEYNLAEDKNKFIKEYKEILIKKNEWYYAVWTC
ncbi:MAG: hypothetical protein M3R36_17415 [Bacteroidota bacterium]|nr:hypothetical protein [Bacteroidota bacterium]